MLSLHGDELAIPFDFIAPSLDVMLENLNNSLFYFINATPDSAQWIISLAIFIAKDVINIVPLLAVVLWLWGPRDRVCAQRQLIVKIGIALIISLAVSWTMGHLFPHDRPFVDHIGYNFLHHAADDSFPSDHGTVIFTFALAFLFWHRLWSGIVMMAIAITIAWSRVYLGVHWPFRYDWRAAGSDAWLPERTADLAVVRRAALPGAATLLPFLFRIAHSKRLGT